MRDLRIDIPVGRRAVDRLRDGFARAYAARRRPANFRKADCGPALLALLACGSLVPAAAHAQAAPGAAPSYPARAVRMIIPWPAGGTTDIVGRIVGQKLAESWKQSVVIDNRGGAGGNIGTEAALKSPADGYTLLFGTMSTHAMNPYLYAQMPFDALGDVATISLAANTASVLVAHPSLPAKNVGALIALARARPGQLNYASGSSSFQLCGELLKMLAKIDLLHVPYKGGAPAVTDLVGGQIETLFTGAPVAIPHIRSGRLNVLGVTNSKRTAILPDVPTIGETLPGYEFNNWAGVMAPAGTPRAVIDRVNADVARVLALAEVREKFLALGADPLPSTPEQFSAAIRADAKRFGTIIRAAGIRAN